ncbi:MAG: DUF6779 domain-containing protein [Pseudonocardiaceae bacterium]
MSRTGDHVSPRRSGRVLILSTFTLAAVAAAVLVLGAQDARLLRLGLVAALWAALLGAFAAARVRREASSYAERSDQLRAVYQLELEREVAARREHALTVEHELRERAELSQRREIVDLRAELAAMRVNLEQLLGADPLAGRFMLPGESTRLLPLAAHSSEIDDSRGWQLAGPEHTFGPGQPSTPSWEPAPCPANGVANGGIVTRSGRHGAPSTEWPGSNVNGSHSNGSGTDGGAARRSSQATPAPQRTVSDLLAANGVASASGSRRRRSHAAN